MLKSSRGLELKYAACEEPGDREHRADAHVHTAFGHPDAKTAKKSSWGYTFEFPE